MILMPIKGPTPHMLHHFTHSFHNVISHFYLLINTTDFIMATSGHVSGLIRNLDLVAYDLLLSPKKLLPSNNHLQMTSTPKTKRAGTPYRLPMAAIEIALDESYCEKESSTKQTTNTCSGSTDASINTTDPDKSECSDTDSSSTDSSSLNSTCLDQYMCSDHSSLYTSSYYDYQYVQEEDSTSTAGTPCYYYSDSDSESSALLPCCKRVVGRTSDSLVSLMCMSPCTRL